MSSSHILVGYDGSPESEAALRWAAGEARMRGLPITVCHVWHWPYRVEPSGMAVRDTMRRMAEQTAAAGVAVITHVTPKLTVRARAVSGPTAETLMALSGDAEAIVVGHRGGGGFAELPTGSVAGQLAAHAHCPVIITRGPIRRGDVVVGVDGSAASDPALALALEEAALRHVAVTAVCSWWDPGAMTASPVIETAELRRKAAVRLEHIIALWREKYPYVEVRTSLVAEPPRSALIEASKDAGLLVVGRRGHGEAPGPLGSVGQALVHRAHCPVAVTGV
ncbi:MAG TPA: universal stress protein [Streptosporangiaceae bacterium]|jgi:nucleotide-binding universal stress UspA family protein